MRLGQVELLPQRQGGKAPYHLFLQLSTCGRELCLHFKITLPQLHTRFQSKAQKGTEVIQGPLEQPVQQVALVLRGKTHQRLRQFESSFTSRLQIPVKQEDRGQIPFLLGRVASITGQEW